MQITVLYRNDFAIFLLKKVGRKYEDVTGQIRFMSSYIRSSVIYEKQNLFFLSMWTKNYYFIQPSNVQRVWIEFHASFDSISSWTQKVFLRQASQNGRLIFCNTIQRYYGIPGQIEFYIYSRQKIYNIIEIYKYRYISRTTTI